MQQHTSLTSLYTALVDARNGYREAVKDAERANLRTLFQDMIALHEQALGELRPELQARGERPDDQGSFMSTVNETVVSIRSAVTGLNQSALGAFASGEERILKNYDKAIDESRNDPPLTHTLERQRQALRVRVEGMKSAAERS